VLQRRLPGHSAARAALGHCDGTPAAFSPRVRPGHRRAAHRLPVRRPRIPASGSLNLPSRHCSGEAAARRAVAIPGGGAHPPPTGMANSPPSQQRCTGRALRLPGRLSCSAPASRSRSSTSRCVLATTKRHWAANSAGTASRTPKSAKRLPRSDEPAPGFLPGFPRLPPELLDSQHERAATPASQDGCPMG